MLVLVTSHPVWPVVVCAMRISSSASQLYRAKTLNLVRELVFGVGSGDSSVFVDHAVEDLVPTDGGVEGDSEGWVVVGRALLASLVWPVVIEMPKVLVEDRGGVALVVDQDPVGALCPDAVHESLGVTVRSRMCWPRSATTAPASAMHEV